MAKQGMKRPERTHTKPKNDAPPVPEIQGKAKHGKEKASSDSDGDSVPSVKMHKIGQREKTLSDAYSVIDTDLARDNVENDFPEAELQDI